MTPETHDHDNEARRQRRLAVRSACADTTPTDHRVRHTNRGVKVQGRQHLDVAALVAAGGFTVKAAS